MPGLDRWLAPGLIITGALLGCAGDLTDPRLTLPPGRVHAAMAPDGMEAPSFSTSTTVPPEYAWAEIRRADARLGWSGSTAVAYSSMEYYGNRGRQTLTLQVLHEYATVGSTVLPQNDGSVLPSVRVMGTPLEFMVPSACGQVANLTVNYRAQIVIFVQTSFTEWSSAFANRQAMAVQPDCEPEPEPEPCAPADDDDRQYMTSVLPVTSLGRGAPPDSYLYDPYDPYDPGTAPQDCDRGGGGGGGGGGGSGDSGETFASMCTSLGGKLYYDYGCIEKYNHTSRQWEVIWCGTYAVCES